MGTKYGFLKAASLFFAAIGVLGILVGFVSDYDTLAKILLVGGFLISLVFFRIYASRTQPRDN